MRVELAELRVDDALLVGGRQKSRQSDQRLLGDLPVALGQAEIGERRESLCVVRSLGQRGLVRLPGPDDVTGFEEHATAPHLDGEALVGVGHALHAALEELRELGLHLARGVDSREAVEHVLVRDVDGGRGLERRERAILVLGVVLPELSGVVPGGELALRDDAAARERLARLGRASPIAGSRPRPHEELPRDDVAGVLDARALEERPRLLGVSEARRRLGRAHEQRRDLERPRRPIDEALGDGQQPGVVAARATMRLQHP